MRGKAKKTGSDAADARITPAYAGKSGEISKYFGYIKDHPRLCGEKPLLSIEVRLWRGSPPPMRGKDDFLWWQNVDNGITPAYAGKSVFVSSGGLLLWDHPRLCGEKGFGLFPQPLHTGSPPPMRGKVVTGQNHGIKVGITPAYAGKR